MKSIHIMRWATIALLAGSMALGAAACADSSDPAADDPANNEGNNDANNDQNNDTNNDQNNDDNNDTNDEEQIRLCQNICETVAECGEFLDACGEDVVEQALNTCFEVCEDDATRPSIIGVSGLPCDVVVPIAIDSFGLADACGGGGSCDNVFCDAPPASCDGNTAVSFTDNGVCDPESGECDFGGVEQRQDCGAQVCDGGVCVDVNDEDLSIYALQNDADPNHPAVDSDVVVNNVIVSANAGGFLWVQEPDGGPFSGIFVEEGELDISGLSPGDRVDIEGTYNEGTGGTEGLATIEATSITAIGSDNAPVPATLSFDEFNADPESWESVLVRFEDLTVTNANPDGDRDFGEFEVNEQLRVDDLLFTIEPDPTQGVTFDAIVGIMNFSFGNFKLEPRDGADVEGFDSGDPCADVECPQLAPACDGNNVVTTTGEGTCVDGACDYEGQQESASCGDQVCVGGECVDAGEGRLVLSEVFYDADGGDNGKEWVEIHNGTDAEIDLSTFSLGYGGGTYTRGTYQLSGTIPAGGCIVVGGATSDDTNGNPTFDLEQDFNPDMQNSGDPADAVGLFNILAADITPESVPIDAVVYGDANTDGFVDSNGDVSAINVADAPAGQTIERIGPDQWQIQEAPTPNNCAVGN